MWSSERVGKKAREEEKIKELAIDHHDLRRYPSIPILRVICGSAGSFLKQIEKRSRFPKALTERFLV